MIFMIFYVAVLMAVNSFLFSVTEFILDPYIYNTKVSELIVK